jgi:uncharacterized membrane protein
MEWSRKYALRSYLRSSLWVVPVLAYVAAFVLARLGSAFDAWLGWSWEWRLQVSTVQSSLEGLVAATISFIVFAFSSLLVAIQVASAQLTPRTHRDYPAARFDNSERCSAIRIDAELRADDVGALAD